MLWGDRNEQPIWRAARLLWMAAISGAAVAVAEALPGVDIPGEFDTVIVTTLTALLAAVDKWARSRARE
jgi:hypothetical protein